MDKNILYSSTSASILWQINVIPHIRYNKGYLEVFEVDLDTSKGDSRYDYIYLLNNWLLW